jgi:hypothetical protein|nr:MAG TPA: RNA ligase [Crassvirales sp.]
MLLSRTQIANLSKLYKNGEEANAIELASFSNNDYKVVVQKGKYNIGDAVILIFPDTQLPYKLEFAEYFAPNGDVNKCKLGCVGGIRNRVRAIKFNLSDNPNKTGSTYSEGLIIPDIDNVPDSELEATVGVFKEESFETNYLPKGLKKTDETNIKQDSGGFIPNELYVLTEKVDGSSCSVMVSDEYPDGIIMSRSRILDKTDNSDPMVKTARFVLNKMLEAGLNNFTFRGEVFGMGFRGSGTSCNPYKNLIPSFALFSIEKFDEKRKIWERISFESTVGYATILHIPIVSTLSTIRPNSIEELTEACNGIFVDLKDRYRQIIEGIVIRSLGETKYSRKILNPEYDSKK